MKTTAKALNHAIELIIETADKLIPEEINRTLPSDWAEKNRVLKEGNFQGPFSFDFTPYLREIVDCFSPASQVREVAVLKGTRMGATVGIGENWIGFTIDVAPGEMAYLTSGGDMAGAQMELRIDSLINSSGFGDKIGVQEKRKNQKKTGDVKTRKVFPGGYIMAGGPRAQFIKRAFGFKYLYVDEVDSFPDSIDKEGDPVLLYRRRVDGYPDSFKILWTSTPLFKHNSKITKLYNEGDKRKYFVPCKHCGHMQFLRWGKKEEKGGLKFEHDEDDRLVAEFNNDGQIISSSVRYECEECGDYWSNSDKDYFLPRGEWRPTATPRRPGMRSYHLPGLLSPVGFRSWESAVIEFLNIKHRGFSPLEFQNWVNTFLGEAFEDRGERPKLEALLTRNRTYHRGFLPEDAKPYFLTLGADIQKDRIECFDGDTELLTADGWKSVSEVSKVDDVATVNLETDALEYQHPTRLISRKHKGDMIKIKSKTTDILVTPNHRMVVYKGSDIKLPKIQLAKDMIPSHKMKASVGNWDGFDREYFTIKQTIANDKPIGKSGIRNVSMHNGYYRARVSVCGKRYSNTFKNKQDAINFVKKYKKPFVVQGSIKINIGDFAEFVGFFIAEGHYGHSYAVVLTQKKEKFVNHIDNLLLKIGIKNYRFKENNGKVTWKIHNKELYRYLKENVGEYSDGKRIPREFLELNREIIKRLFNGYHIGDGWMMRGEGRKERLMMATASKWLADDLQEVMIKLGYRVNINVRKPQKENWKTMYYVSQLGSKAISNKTKKNGEMVQISEPVEYDGNVYCVSVPNTTVVARRNGKMFVAGNCEIVAWSNEKISHSIDYHVIPGDTADIYNECWTALGDIIKAPHAGHKIKLAGIDAGFRTEIVYQFCDEAGANVFPVMGTENLTRGRDYIKFFQVSGHNLQRVDINTDLLKQEIYQNLAKGEYEDGSQPPGYCNFPMDYDRQHFNRLTAEKRVMKNTGAKKYIWDAGSRRNEQLDIRVYALAMVYCYKQAAEDYLKESKIIDEELKFSWSIFWNYVKSEIKKKETKAKK